MNLDQALAKAFEISLLIRIKLPNPIQRGTFLEKILQSSAQQKREFFVTLRKADQALKDLDVDFLDSTEKAKQKIVKITEEAKSLYRTAKTTILKKERQSFEPNI